MKKLIITLLFISSISLFANSGLPFSWKQGAFSYKREMNNIKKDKIPIILYVYATWCPYCKTMNKKLSNSKVQKYLKGFTKIAIDGGTKKLHRKKSIIDIMQKYGITGFPSLVLIYPNGRHKSVYVSSRLSNSEFLKKLKRRVGKRAHKIAKRNGSKKAELNEKEIADLYNGNGTKPKIIEFSDEVGENSNMRAYKVITENSKSKYHNNLGDMYLAKRKYFKAESEYFAAIKFDKKSQRAFYGLGLVYYKVAIKKKGFRKLKLLKTAKSYLKTAKVYEGSYVIEVQKLLKKLNKLIIKENKKYK